MANKRKIGSRIKAGKPKTAKRTKTQRVITLMRREKIRTSEASPNFVNYFASAKGINLTSKQVIDISDKYNLKKRR